MFSNPSSNVNLALKKTSLINLDSKQLTARVNAYKAEIHIIHALISMAKRGLGEKMKKKGMRSRSPTITTTHTWRWRIIFLLAHGRGNDSWVIATSWTTQQPAIQVSHVQTLYTIITFDYSHNYSSENSKQFGDTSMSNLPPQKTKTNTTPPKNQQQPTSTNTMQVTLISTEICRSQKNNCKEAVVIGLWQYFMDRTR